MKSQFQILLVEDMESFRAAVSQMLGVYNDVSEAGSLGQARLALSKQNFDIIILDKNLPDGDGIEFLKEIKSTVPNTVVIMLTSDSDLTSIKHCIAHGADDYVIKTENVVPDLLVRIPLAISKAAASRKQQSLERMMKEAFRYEIIGKSVSTMELRETVLSLKGSTAHVFITGESGTGKELIARRLNSIEEDRNRPFVALNCGAISEGLIESELFGHKKGSFTGAVNDHVGKFEQADGGDLFLDEIGELSLSAQVKLLRAIQEGEICRLGDNRIIKINCRIIAATNRNPEQMVSVGTFREDLYHRLNVVRIQTTPLRDRITDIKDMAIMFAFQVGGPNFKISDKAIKALKDYDWPGNIRELRNAIERAAISAKRQGRTEIAIDDVSIQNWTESLQEKLRRLQVLLPAHRTELTPGHYQEFFEAAERAYLKTALELTEGAATEVASRLGLARSTTFRRIKMLEATDGKKKKPGRQPLSKVSDSGPKNETLSPVSDSGPKTKILSH